MKSRTLALVLLVGLAGAERSRSQSCVQRVETLETSHFYSYFGISFHAEGDRMLVGTPGFEYDQPNQNHGIVEAFERDPQTGTWTRSQLILPPLVQPFASFGYRVRIDGDRAFVATAGEPAYPSGDGSAIHVYAWDVVGGQWAWQQVLFPPLISNSFARAFDVRGDRLLVGDYGRDEALVYERDPQTDLWSYTATLVPGPTNPIQFGFAVALGDDVALVGSPMQNPFGRGGVRVFRRDPQAGTWALTQFDHGGDVDGSAYGYALDLEGDRLAVGAPGAGGRVDLLHVPPVQGALQFEASVVDPSSAGPGGFGEALDLRGERLLVGASEADEVALESGVAWVFERDPQGGLWGPGGRVLPGETEELDHFGRGVQLTDDAILGFPYEYPSQSVFPDGGAIYVFPIAPGADCNGNLLDDACELATGSLLDVDGNGVADACEGLGLGRRLCPGITVPNSSGLPARVLATGSAAVVDNALDLTVFGLPSSSFGYFLVSEGTNTAYFASPVGHLCLTGTPIGRFSSQVLFTGAGSTVQLTPDLTQLPTPNGTEAVQPGESRHFQYWYRDGTDSNFSDAVAVGFQ